MTSGLWQGAYLEVHGLTKQFRSTIAVNNLSFAAPPGTVTGFLGPNGAGKTTTLRMMLGLIRPTAGTATVGSVPFTNIADPARAVGAVLDSLSLHPKRTALGHLKVYAAAIGVPDTRAHEVLGLVGLAEVANRRAGTFSLGMRQRLALATALLGDPPVLILDEPANGLDPEGIAWLRDFLRSYAKRGGTVLISSHILREVEQTVDNVVIISRGTLVYQGALDALRGANRSRILVAASSPFELASALVAKGITDAHMVPDGRLAVAGLTKEQIDSVAQSAGIEVFGTALDSVDLEHVFLQLTSGQFAAQHAPPPQTYSPPPGYYHGPTDGVPR